MPPPDETNTQDETNNFAKSRLGKLNAESDSVESHRTGQVASFSDRRFQLVQLAVGEFRVPIADCTLGQGVSGVMNGLSQRAAISQLAIGCQPMIDSLCDVGRAFGLQPVQGLPLNVLNSLGALMQDRRRPNSPAAVAARQLGVVDHPCGLVYSFRFFCLESVPGNRDPGTCGQRHPFRCQSRHRVNRTALSIWAVENPDRSGLAG
jgi:hypothetical protein